MIKKNQKTNKTKKQSVVYKSELFRVMKAMLFGWKHSTLLSTVSQSIKNPVKKGQMRADKIT